MRSGNVDAKGRLKLPASLKRSLSQRYQSMELFVTSLDGTDLKVFPLREWEGVEESLSQHNKSNILFYANHYGTEQKLDAQGRFLVSSQLRTSAAMKGPVRIQWKGKHMLVMNEARYERYVAEHALTASDLQEAANFGL